MKPPPIDTNHDPRVWQQHLIALEVAHIFISDRRRRINKCSSAHQGIGIRGPYLEFAISSRGVVVVGNANDSPHYLVMGMIDNDLGTLVILFDVGLLEIVWCD